MQIDNTTCRAWGEEGTILSLRSPLEWEKKEISRSPVMFMKLNKLNVCLYGIKQKKVEGSTPESYPGRANFSYISLQNVIKHFRR